MSEGTVLQRIVAAKREAVAAREACNPLEALRARVVPSDRDFFGALAASGLGLIAEVKRCSPSMGLIRKDFDPIEIARIYDRHAVALSVLCDEPFFGGSLEHLRLIRAVTARPLLCKDFILTPYQVWEARAHGADALLLMASLLEPGPLEELLGLARSLGMEPLVEVHDARELEAVLSTSARIIGINNRDLRTLRIDPENVLKLAPLIPGDRLRVAESGVSRLEEVERLREGVDAVLIGTTFMQAPDIERQIEALGW